MSDIAIIRYLLLKKAFDRASAVDTAVISKFTGVDIGNCTKSLLKLQEDLVAYSCFKTFKKTGKVSCWFLNSAASINRVCLNPEYYSGSSSV